MRECLKVTRFTLKNIFKSQENICTVEKIFEVYKFDTGAPFKLEETVRAARGRVGRGDAGEGEKNKTIKDGGISPWTSGTYKRLQMATWNDLNKGIEKNKKHN